MHNNPISITAFASISPLGHLPDDVWNNYLNGKHLFTIENSALVGKLSKTSEELIEELRASNIQYKFLDNSVLYALYTSRLAVKTANWNVSENFGINFGSSRGATALFESYYKDFLKTKKAATLSSPTTTLGNISSWIAHDLQSNGPEISHSITCSTALHAMLNGIAWLSASMCDKFLIGGSEAPLTPFTIAQMQALRIYATKQDKLPCKALDFSKVENTMILSEGAAAICLESGKKDNALAFVSGYGYGTELLKHNVSLSSDALCFQKSMRMALRDFNLEDIDVIITHTPGTIKGDLAEYNAIKKIFGDATPALTNNKVFIGHSLGASGALNLEMALLMLQKQKFIPNPFKTQHQPKKLEHIMVNAVGFGGNAVSIIISNNL